MSILFCNFAYEPLLIDIRKLQHILMLCKQFAFCLVLLWAGTRRFRQHYFAATESLKRQKNNKAKHKQYSYIMASIQR